MVFQCRVVCRENKGSGYELVRDGIEMIVPVDHDDGLRRVQFAHAEARRQRSLVYMVTVLMFLMIFDKRAHREHMMGQQRLQRSQRLRGANPGGGGGDGGQANQHMRAPKMVVPFARGLHAALQRGAPSVGFVPFATNISGRFHGGWGSGGGGGGGSGIDVASIVGSAGMAGGDAHRRPGSGVTVANSALEASLPRATFDPGVGSGALELQLAASPFAGTLQPAEIGVVRGLLQLHGSPADGGRYMLAGAQGVFLGASGRLSLFINSQRNLTRELEVVASLQRGRGGVPSFGLRTGAVQRALDRISMAWDVPATTAAGAAPIAQGAAIEARFGGKALWYPGKVARAHADGSFDIVYADGDAEEKVAALLVRPDKAAAAVQQPPAHKRVRVDVASLQPPRYHSGGVGEHCYFRAELDALPGGSDGDGQAGGRAGGGDAHMLKAVSQGKVAAAAAATDAVAAAAPVRRREIGGFKGVLWSPNCGNGTVLNVTLAGRPVHWPAVYAKAARYAFGMMLVSIGKLQLLVKQLRYSGTPAQAAKLSMLTIGHQAVLDAYLCLMHLGGGMVMPQLFASFATVAFFKLVLFSVFEMRFLVLVWKARRPAAFSEGWPAMRRELSMLYSRFYASLLLGIFFVYRFGRAHPTFVTLALYSYWVPQIAHSAYCEVRRPFLRRYLLGTAAARLAIPLYFIGCPVNFVAVLTGWETGTSGNGRLCALLVLWTAAQVGVVLAQDVLGPRFFIPRALQPKKYDYRRQIAPPPPAADGGTVVVGFAAAAGALDCPICMSEVDMTTGTHLVTPCDHVFHDECLQQWMEVKMECPSCRAQLPPVSDDRSTED